MVKKDKGVERGVGAENRKGAEHSSLLSGQNW